METNVTESTPVAMLTVGQLANFLNNHPGETATQEPEHRGARPALVPEQGKYIYGLRGIRQRYGVGKNTACGWVRDDGILAPAVIREGRKIIVNAEKADLILEQWTQEQRQRKAAR